MSAEKKLTKQEINGLFERISNWGRWGKDDERGALNYITDAKRVAAARLVQTGEAISLARSATGDGSGARQSDSGHPPDDPVGP